MYFDCNSTSKGKKKIFCHLVRFFCDIDNFSFRSTVGFIFKIMDRNRYSSFCSVTGLLCSAYQNYNSCDALSLNVKRMSLVSCTNAKNFHKR